MSDPRQNFEETQRISDMLKEAKHTMVQICKTPHQGLEQKNGEEFRQFMKHMDDLRNFYQSAVQHPESEHEMNRYRQELTKLAFHTTGTYRAVSHAVKSLLRKGGFVTQTEDHAMTKSVSHMKTLLAALMDFSCDSKEVRKKMAENHDFLSALVHTLKAGQEAHLKEELSNTQDEILNSCLRILISCTFEGKTIIRLREAGTVNAVIPYLDSHNDSIQLDSIRLLAKLINEREAEDLLAKNMAIISLIIKQLEEAQEISDHLQGLIKILGDLGRSDANKKALVDEGCLHPLVNIVDSEYGNKVEESLDTMWVVSFEEKNKQKMADEPNLVNSVWEKYTDESSSPGMKKSCYGILWSLNEPLKTNKQYAEIAAKTEEQKDRADMEPIGKNQPDAQNMSKDDGCFEGHVMLSYNWEYQKTILNISQKLKEAGVPVWIDKDLMKGSLLETMAKAVEDCSIFLMAVCKGYKDSSNCRLEAEYAKTRKKTIIPLMMERGYQPDGWLGIIMGSQLYYDFSGKETFDDIVSTLVNVVREEMDKQASARKDEQTPKPEPVLPSKQLMIERQTQTDEPILIDRQEQTDGPAATTERTTQTKKLVQSNMQVQTDKQIHTDIVYVQTDRMIYTPRATQTGEETYDARSSICNLM